MRIVVAGIPAPQGSKRHVGGGRMIESSKAVGPWREAVRAETQQAFRLSYSRFMVPRTPVAAEITFYLPKPKSAPRKRAYPVTRPDVDKLARAVLDGLQAGGAFADDSQIVALTASKIWADGRPPGCVIYLVDPEEEA